MNKNRILSGILLFYFSIDFPLPVSAVKNGIDELENNSSIIKNNRSHVCPSNTSIKEEEFLATSKQENPNFFGRSNIDNIPIEILYEICYKLRPLNILNLAISSKHLKQELSDLFWENYLIIHKQKNWNESIPLIKIVFSYSFFEGERIEDAAALGLPEAIKFLDMNKTNSQKQKKRKKKIRTFFQREVLEKIEYSMSNACYNIPTEFVAFPMITGAYLLPASTLGYGSYNTLKYK